MQLCKEVGFSETADEWLIAVAHLLESTGLDGDFSLHRLNHGRNNQVFRVDTDGKHLLIKHYFNHPDDVRNRLGTEIKFLNFVWTHGIRCVPQLFGFDDVHRLGLFQYLDGTPLVTGQIGQKEIKQAADFIRFVNEARSSEDAKDLPKASEGCFSIKEHFNAIEARVKKLQATDLTADCWLDARDFIRSDLGPAWDLIKLKFEKDLKLLGISIDEVVAPEEQCISPSDFGFHNAILGSDGQLLFFDFEYAGWDDPAKLVCDFFCQPQIPAPSKWKHFFIETATINLPRRDKLFERIKLVAPLHRLKWCCIALNECLSEGLERRRFSGLSSSSSYPNVKSITEKARILLSKAFLI